jgi:predicted aldo/keto reductase-like oxidoreductase
MHRLWNMAILDGDVCVASVKEAIAAGYLHIDTAQGYCNRESVGIAVKGSVLARRSFSHQSWQTMSMVMKRRSPPLRKLEKAGRGLPRSFPDPLAQPHQAPQLLAGSEQGI